MINAFTCILALLLLCGCAANKPVASGGARVASQGPPKPVTVDGSKLRVDRPKRVLAFTNLYQASAYVHTYQAATLAPAAVSVPAKPRTVTLTASLAVPVAVAACDRLGGGWQPCTNFTGAVTLAGDAAQRYFCQSYSQALQWNASPGALGYKVYWGDGRAFQESDDVGNVTNETVMVLMPGPELHFVVSAYNATEESDFSNEVVSYPPAVKLGIRSP